METAIQEHEVQEPVEMTSDPGEVWVEIRTDCEPWLCASTDETRPSLRVVCLEPDGSAVATNGHVLVVCHEWIRIDDNNHQLDKRLMWDAKLLADAIKGWRKAWPKFLPSPPAIILPDGSLKLKGPDGQQWVVGPADAVFPKWQDVVPTASEPVHKIGINPNYIRLVAQALGGREALKDGNMVRIGFAGESKAMRIDVWTGHGQVPGYGIIMPMRVDDSDWTYKL